jgi:hypothetical protein
VTSGWNRAENYRGDRDINWAPVIQGLEGVGVFQGRTQAVTLMIRHQQQGRLTVGKIIGVREVEVEVELFLRDGYKRVSKLRAGR